MFPVDTLLVLHTVIMFPWALLPMYLYLQISWLKMAQVLKDKKGFM